MIWSLRECLSGSAILGISCYTLFITLYYVSYGPPVLLKGVLRGALLGPEFCKSSINLYRINLLNFTIGINNS
jgi:hypothetical protein